LEDRDHCFTGEPPEPSMVYLIGVNHVVQFGAPSRAPNSKIVREKRESFKAHVLEIIEKLNITILAEEFSQEAKKSGT
jgi:hypothetical protein